jgi:DNA polymerase I-like protein with 3'-5' exonuclease and polymerase domains
VGKFPNLIKWRERIKVEAQTNGKLRNVYGRVRYFFEDRVSTKAYNFPVQSSSSDMVLENMHTLFDMGYTLNLPVHDFFAIQTDEDKAEKTQDEISQILKRPNSKFGGWSFLFKTKVGRNWEEVS